MEKRYLDLVKDFKELDIEDKKEEIANNLLELLKLLYVINKEIDLDNTLLPIYNNSMNDDEYFTKIFTYIISLKEENAKLLEKMHNYN